jgi:hypothetical protein
VIDGGYEDPQGLNRYSYVKGHVMSANDPTGHSSCYQLGPCSNPNYINIGNGQVMAIMGATTAVIAAGSAIDYTGRTSIPMNPGPAIPSTTAGSVPTVDTTSVSGVPVGAAPTSVSGATSIPSTSGGIASTTPLNPTVGLNTTGPSYANPYGSKGNPAHQQAVRSLQSDLAAKWGLGYTVRGNVPIAGLNNANTGQTIVGNRRPDATVIETGTRNVVEIGEAYRTATQGTYQPVPREMKKMNEYQNQGIPSTWRKVQ